MTTSITFLGTGTAVPDANRGPTATLLRADGRSVLVDCGSGTLQKLHRAGGDLLTLDALVVTHAHFDHLADLFPILFALFVPQYDRANPLLIYLSERTLGYVSKVQDVFGRWLDPGDAQVEFRTLDVDERHSIAGFDVTTHAVRHDPSSVGFRFTAPDGTVIAVPGDSGPCESLAAICADADMAVLECSLPDSIPLESHLTPSQVADVVNTAGVRRLAVVHRYPLALAADCIAQIRAHVEAEVVAPEDGDRYELPTPA